MSEKELHRLIRAKEQGLRENLLKTPEAQAVHKSFLDFLDAALVRDSIPWLRYRRLRETRGTPLDTWWTGDDGYPLESPWKQKFDPLLQILEAHYAEKTLKKRLTLGGFFVESRIQGEDQHILVGKRDGSGHKAHVVIDGVTGEIRIDERDQPPEEVLKGIETVLTLASGRKVRSTREALEEITEA